MLKCPFCGAAETDRFDLEGQRFLVFSCMFTPAVDPLMGDRELEDHLRTAYPPDASGAYFRRMCDRLHLYVTQGEGARNRTGGTDPARDRGDP